MASLTSKQIVWAIQMGVSMSFATAADLAIREAHKHVADLKIAEQKRQRELDEFLAAGRAFMKPVMKALAILHENELIGKFNLTENRGTNGEYVHVRIRILDTNNRTLAGFFDFNKFTGINADNDHGNRAMFLAKLFKDIALHFEFNNRPDMFEKLEKAAQKIDRIRGLKSEFAFPDDLTPKMCRPPRRA